MTVKQTKDLVGYSLHLKLSIESVCNELYHCDIGVEFRLIKREVMHGSVWEETLIKIES